MQYRLLSKHAEASNLVFPPSFGGFRASRRTTPIYPGQADITSCSLAEWLCRTVDRTDPTQVSGPCGNLERSGFPSGSEILRRLLQSCFITPICLCDWGEEVLLIWMRSRAVILVLPRAMNDALSRRFAER